MDRFDEIVKSVRDDLPEAAAEREAAGRVRGNLFGVAGAAEAAARIHGCEGFRSLIPAHLGKSLSEARRLLLEDHLHECAACRAVFDDARGVRKVRALPVNGAAARRSSVARWAVAAAIVAAAGLGALRLVSPGFGGAPAVVRAAKGPLFVLADSGTLPAGEGRQLLEGEQIRTGTGAGAMVELFDGSRIEMNERSQLSVRRGWRSTTIQLAGGRIIVEAAKQKRGRLYVMADSEIAVKGTIFAVNRGMKGTRVSVVEGAVEVSQNGATQSLKPGDQASSDPSLIKVAVADEVAWSQSAARYLALLGEFNVLQKRLEAIPGKGLRYQSKLLRYIPADTVMFAALPNEGAALAEAKRIFDEQLRQSPVLQQWWTTSLSAKDRAEFETLLTEMSKVAAELGDEIVIAAGGPRTGTPVMLGEARNAAVVDLLRAASGKFHHEQNKIGHFAFKNGILIASPDAARVKMMELAVQAGGNPATPFRDRIAQYYSTGVGWLFFADLEQINAKFVTKERDRQAFDAIGFTGAKYGVGERKEMGGSVENLATVTFSGPRRGISAWIGSPGSMSSLDFMTPEAGAAASFVVKSPRAMVEEWFALARQQSPNFEKHLAEVERELGLKIVDDIAAALGAEATFGIDGPLLPVPSWKAAVEVYLPQRLQYSIGRLLESYNRQEGARSGKLVLNKEDAGGVTYYKIAGGSLLTDIHYTFTDGYLVAGPSRTAVTQAIQARRTGRSLARSSQFRQHLPRGANPNFSGVVYYNIAPMLGPLADQLQGANAVPAELKRMFGSVRDAQPGLLCAYAEGDRLTAATRGNFVNLGMLAGMDQLHRLLEAPPKARN